MQNRDKLIRRINFVMKQPQFWEGMEWARSFGFVARWVVRRKLRRLITYRKLEGR
jgi:hypothetical protein